MYMGITAHHNAPSVRCFADAQKALAKASLTPTGRARKPSDDGMFPLGLTKRGQTCIGEMDDGSIAFRLYETDVVAWHPDNSCIIENFGTVTTTGFARRFSPEGIYLSHPVTKQGWERGHKGFRYHTYYGDDWRRRWKTARICFGQGDTVRFVPEGGVWVPDQSTLSKIVFPELDMAGARDMSKALHFRDFTTWLGMAPHHIEIEHEGFDTEACEKALRQRDFLGASRHLPTVKADGFGRCLDAHALPFRFVRGGSEDIITLGSIGKLKLALWEENGLLKDAIFTDIGAKEFDRRMARVKALDALGFEGIYGPRS
jgi:hypothetical protein